MAKKSSIMKKLNPILKEADNLKKKKKYDDAVTKYREAISFIRLKGKDMENREVEVSNVISLLNQTLSAEIHDIITQANQLGWDKKFDEALNELNNALSKSDNIDDPNWKDTEKIKINKAIDQTNLKVLVDQGEKIKAEGKFDDAIEIFNKALNNANEIYTSEMENIEIRNIKNLINQTYSNKIKLMTDQGSLLKQNGEPDDAIKTYENAIEIAEKMFNSELKNTELYNIKNQINQIYSEKINPNIEKGKQLIEQNNKDEAVIVLKTALNIQNKMYDSDLKNNDLNKIGELINPILIERIETTKEKGLQLIKQEKYEESIATVTEAAKTFRESLDIADEMADSREKVEKIEQVTSLIDQTCLAGIKVREERGIQLIAQKKFEEAVGEMYSALSIAKNMVASEDENEEIEKIKSLVNHVYIAQTNEILEKGRDLLEQKKYEEARDIFNEAMGITNKMYLSEEMEREISTVKNLLYQAEMKQVVAEGYVSEEQQKFEEEIENLKKELDNANLITDAERRNKKISEVKHQIDTTYSNQINLSIEQGDQLAEQIKFDNAIEIIDNALRFIDLIENHIIKDNDLIKIIDSVAKYGNLLANKNQFEESFKDFEKALNVAEKISDKNTKKEEIIKIKGFYTQELNNKAQIDIEHGELDSAINCCKKGIELDDNFPVSYNNMGNAYINKQEYDSAIDFFKKAVKLDPEYKEAWNNMGFTYELKTDYDNALDSIQMAVEIDENYAIAWYNMGNVYKHRNESDQAIESYKKAIELKPDYARAWLFMANIYHEKKEYNIAIKHLEKAVELDPDISKEMSQHMKDFKELISLLQNKFSEMFKNK